MGNETPVLVAAMAVALICCLSIVSATLVSLNSTTNLPTPRAQNPASSTAATPKIQKFAMKTTASSPTPTHAPVAKGGANAPPPSGKTVVTTSTYHTSFDTNSCNNMKPDPMGYNTAMSADLASKLGVPKTGPGSPTCGRMLLVTDKGTKKTIKVKVLDLRGNEHGLDLHQPAFVELAGSAGVAAGVANVTVGFV